MVKYDASTAAIEDLWLGAVREIWGDSDTSTFDKVAEIEEEGILYGVGNLNGIFFSGM